MHDDVYVSHEISVKIAIYAMNGASVFLMHYPQRDFYGLAGGHLEANETPDQALARELDEELGLPVSMINDMRHADFFLRSSRDQSVILAYTGTAGDDFAINPPLPDDETGAWVTRADVESMTAISDHYKDFILEQWPVPSVATN